MPRKIDISELNHLEDADWCALIRHRSPGDVFRFLHAVQLKSQADPKKCCVVCAPDDFASVSPLIGNSAEIMHQTPGWALAKVGGNDFANVEWLVLNGLGPYTSGFERPIRSLLATWEKSFQTNFSFAQEDCIVLTTYSDHRSFNRGYKQEGIVEFKRIDQPNYCESFPASTACFGRIPTTTLNDNQPIQVAVVLRCASDWRASPSAWFKRDFYETLEKSIQKRLEFSFFGLSESMYAPWPRWLKIEQCHSYTGKTLPQQVEEARRFHLATGVNSSALDVFSIAGVPVLRDCEFQAQARANDWPFQVQYNSFLAGNLNIGLGIHSDAFPRQGTAQRDWVDMDFFVDAFAVLANRLNDLSGEQIKWGGSPKHEHAEYRASRENIDKQIDNVLNAEDAE